MYSCPLTPSFASHYGASLSYLSRKFQYIKRVLEARTLLFKIFTLPLVTATLVLGHIGNSLRGTATSGAVLSMLTDTICAHSSLPALSILQYTSLCTPSSDNTTEVPVCSATSATPDSLLLSLTLKVTVTS